MKKTRPVSWIKAALKVFERFPEGSQSIFLAALTIAAEGGKADIAKPMHGMGSGVFPTPVMKGYPPATDSLANTISQINGSGNYFCSNCHRILL